MQKQLSNRQVTVEGFSQGILRFVIGLGKKVIFANALSDISPFFLDGNLKETSILGVWVGIILFALQIYFDFSGYSDMAIGLGKMFGLTFKENFHYPYISRSAAEFWRRWNISVGGFFRDYVYIPLGGNRHRPVFNLFLVWFLTGLWHGASWNYICWGLYFGILIFLERRFLNRLLVFLPRMVSHLYFSVIVLVGWVLFYFVSLDRAIIYLKTMFGMNSLKWINVEDVIQLQNHMFLITAAVIAATPFPAYLHRGLSERMKPAFARGLYVNALLPVACLGILVVLVVLLVGKTYTPFFYFRF